MKIDPNLCHHSKSLTDCVYCAAEMMHGFQALAKGVNLFYKRHGTNVEVAMNSSDGVFMLSPKGEKFNASDTLYLMSLGWSYQPEVGYWTFERG
jgi:hypothetical protein